MGVGFEYCFAIITGMRSYRVLVTVIFMFFFFFSFFGAGQA